MSHSDWPNKTFLMTDQERAEARAKRWQKKWIPQRPLSPRAEEQRKRQKEEVELRLEYLEALRQHDD